MDGAWNFVENELKIANKNRKSEKSDKPKKNQAAFSNQFNFLHFRFQKKMSKKLETHGIKIKPWPHNAEYDENQVLKKHHLDEYLLLDRYVS